MSQSIVRRKKGRKGSKFNFGTAHSATRVPRGLYAAEMDVAIPVHDATGWGTTSLFFGVAYKLNSLADSNWNYIGLSNFNAIYKRYRVLAFDVRAQVASTHATNTQVCSGLITNSSTAAASSAIVFANGVNPGGKIIILSTITGGSELREMRFRSKVAEFEGTQEVETSSDFAAATSAVADPAQLLYLQIGACDLFGASITGAVRILLTGHMWVRYFDAVQQ